MKKVVPLNNFILCQPIAIQESYGNLILPNQDNKKTTVRKVLEVSENLINHNSVKPGDIVVTRQAVYPTLPYHLTEDDCFPIKPNDNELVEILDVANVICVYRNQKTIEQSAPEAEKEDNNARNTSDPSGY